MDLLASRYASAEMGAIFSPYNRAKVMREVWLALATAQKETGLDISDEQLKELESNVENIDLEKVEEYERETHHDVVAHLRLFADQCPKAAPILHLGATSATITDNADALLITRGLDLLCKKLTPLLKELGRLAEAHKGRLCLGYTHLQPAQPTTFGKRVALWAQDLLSDLEDLQRTRSTFPCLGAKGATGSQASFLALYGSCQKVAALDWRFARLLGFTYPLLLSTQTYSRKADAALLDTLSQLALSFSKMATDIRLLAHLGEVAEPFAKSQVGSSAMPYKQNPILSERICSLARHLITLSQNPKQTAATQWLERSLDDSANRRLTLPQAFLTADALVDLAHRIVTNLNVYPEEMERRLQKELPYLATEAILMECVKRGGNRQELHEKLRVHCEGGREDLLERIAADSAFSLSKEELGEMMQPERHFGCTREQVEYFLERKLGPYLESMD